MASVWDRRYGPHDDHYPTHEEVQIVADRIIATIKSQEEVIPMSWSVGAVGKNPAIRTEIAEQFNRGSKCMEPEESIRQSVAQTIDKALESV